MTVTLSVPQVHPTAHSYCTMKSIQPVPTWAGPIGCPTISIHTALAKIDKLQLLTAQNRFIHMWSTDMPAKYPQFNHPTNPVKAAVFAQACYMIATSCGQHTLPHFDGFGRDFLLFVANQLGYSYIPAWIVKDKARRLDRSKYMVPEVAIYATAFLTATPCRTQTTNEDTINA